MVASLSTPSVTSATPGSLKQALDPASRLRPKAEQATEGESTQVSISAEALKQAEQEPVQAVAAEARPAQPARAPETPAPQAQNSSASAAAAQLPASGGRGGLPEAAYRPADGNKDGLVSVLEQEAYDFEHPSLEKPADSSALKAYADVARNS
ncbi:hypothetical protein RQP53_12465 [Paucibacter sp. APW11]|uniref:EF-hand domain-containing protein n=1 Tax=Roseateles aquae TaxID=3077235 RepID=A0ABU3PBY8_9BURK|nr:hypothetical protein [Paucibacter sp. APW11]MDT9000081.1 hypothetical protein [Paucibacter sp. APW11]